METRAVSREDSLHQAVAAVRPPLPRHVRPIVILGAGGIVRAAHLPAYRKAGFPVIGIADREPGKASGLATEHGVMRAFDSIAAAVNFAPPDAVFDLAVRASQLAAVLPLLPHRAAVLMQKPMGETLAESRELRNICRKRELTAAVNFQLRYAPNHLGAVVLAREGVLGEVHDIEVQVTPTHHGNCGVFSRRHRGWKFFITASTISIWFEPDWESRKASTPKLCVIRRVPSWPRLKQ